tara:strand:+ start:618 stop:722 length:105 start_codon:yes stop_codon:yes gene_type:complete
MMEEDSKTREELSEEVDRLQREVTQLRVVEEERL